MIILTKRQKDILIFLCEQEEFVTFSILAKKFSISKKTIQNDIHHIDAFLKEKKIELIKKPGIGLFVKAEFDQKINLCKKLDTIELRNFSKLERKALIMASLLCRSLNTFQELADICLVSKQTIINSFSEIEIEFAKENLSIEKIHGTGLRLKGEEIDIRRIFIQLIKDNPCQQFVEELVKEQGELNDCIENANILLDEIEKDSQIFFNNRTHLKYIIGFIMKRIERDKKLSEKTTFENLSQHYSIESMTIKLSKFISQKNEQLYIITIMLSERISQLSNPIDSSISETHDEAYEISMFLIESLQTLQPIDESYLQDTIRGLTSHIRSAINRYRNNLKIKNELVDQIRLSASLIYEFTNKQLHKIEKKYNLEFDENEVAYITMYIASIFETSYREINTLRILLVCSFGLATSSILKSRIKQSFPGFQILGPFSQGVAKSYLEDNQIDLIISTNDFEHYKIPIIKVNPLLDYESIEKIKNKLDQFSYSKMCSYFINSYAFTNKVEQNQHFIFNYVTNDNIQIIDKCDSWEEAIQLAATPLLKKLIINQHYVDMMIDAVIDYGTYMVMTPKTAYVHAGANDGIQKNCIAILILKEPIMFGYTNAKQVSNIVILGIKDKRENELLNIAYIFENTQNLEKLSSKEITKEIIMNMHD